MKLFTGSIVRPDHIVPMEVGIARAAVDEAHRNGQLVFSHPSNLKGTQVAIDARRGRSGAHPGGYEGIDEAILRRMIAQHTTIIPTLKLFSRDDAIAKIRQPRLPVSRAWREIGLRYRYGISHGLRSRRRVSPVMQAGFGFRDVLAMLTTAPAELFHLSQNEGKVMRWDARRSDDSVGRPGVGESEGIHFGSIHHSRRQSDLAMRFVTPFSEGREWPARKYQLLGFLPVWRQYAN